jgi:hypothetical protein
VERVSTVHTTSLTVWFFEFETFRPKKAPTRILFLFLCRRCVACVQSNQQPRTGARHERGRGARGSLMLQAWFLGG